ncbi:hypothetical protein AB0L04_05475 [Streptomyces glaucescens]|uniref:hypothetical protein n=1 Tax=Streptomyces glaucescens TaxID=1907 RepID=UPI00344F6321
MRVDRLPAGVREFADYLDGLLARLDPGGGWYAVFRQRDPVGMRACLDGREVLPWDVLEALLEDLAARHGPGAAAERERARALHAAALAAHDARPGGRDALGDRLDAMLREQEYAAARLAELARLLARAPSREAADALRRDLAWARDDHHRATARIAGLRARIAGLDRRRSADGERGAWVQATPGAGTEAAVRDPRPDRERAGGAGTVSPGLPGTPDPRPGRRRAAPAPAPAPAAPGTPAPEASAAPHAPASIPPAAPAPPASPGAAKQRRRRRGGARFAWAAEDDGAPAAVPPTTEPALPALPARTGRTPRGARFAGAGQAAAAPPAPAEAVDEAARQEAVALARALARLRAEGRSGEAHALLAEAAHWPTARFPLLAAELERAGLGADWATLLWETASLPAERLAGAADALTAAGRDADAHAILRQGVARPAAEIGQAVRALAAEGRHRELHALLGAYVRVRTPEEAARCAAADPPLLVPLLLEAAGRVSAECRRDLVHALRVAGPSA